MIRPRLTSAPAPSGRIRERCPSTRDSWRSSSCWSSRSASRRTWWPSSTRREGKAFVGAFYYADDLYNYLSYAQQAEDGAFLFQNRVLLEEHPPALVNLEWWLVGRLSAALGGGRLLLAYRLLGILPRPGASSPWPISGCVGSASPGATASQPWCSWSPGAASEAFSSRSLAAAVEDCLDLYAGLYPFLGLLASPHFVAGTTLLLACLAPRSTRLRPCGAASSPWPPLPPWPSCVPTISSCSS